MLVYIAYCMIGMGMLKVTSFNMELWILSFWSPYCIKAIRDILQAVCNTLKSGIVTALVHIGILQMINELLFQGHVLFPLSP